jgi:hypothetical protein
VRTINVYADDGTGPADDDATSIVRIKLNDSKAADDADDADDLFPHSSGSVESVMAFVHRLVGRGQLGGVSLSVVQATGRGSTGYKVRRDLLDRLPPGKGLNPAFTDCARTVDGTCELAGDGTHGDKTARPQLHSSRSYFDRINTRRARPVFARIATQQYTYGHIL